MIDKLVLLTTTVLIMEAPDLRSMLGAMCLSAAAFVVMELRRWR